MARLYANENFPLPVVERLRQLGHDVLTTTDAGRHDPTLADQVVLVFAISEARAVLTLNRKHFIRLHAVQAEHRGIIVCTFDPTFPARPAEFTMLLRQPIHSIVNWFASIGRRIRNPTRLGVATLFASCLICFARGAPGFRC